MKKLFTLLFFCCIFLNCSENSNDATFTNPKASTFANTPDAKAIFDNSHMGVYKGIVIGGISGTLYVNIFNDGLIWAKFQAEDKVTYTLEQVPLLKDDNKSSEPYLIKYRFANEKMSFEMKLDTTGNEITVSNFKYFSDNSSKICLIKEKSNSLVKCFTGIYSNDDQYGNVNFVTNGESSVRGFSKNLYDREISVVKGAIEPIVVIIPYNEVISLLDEADPTIQYRIKANLHVGQISGLLKRYTFDGDWMFNDNKIGTWNATRLL